MHDLDLLYEAEGMWPNKEGDEDIAKKLREVFDTREALETAIEADDMAYDVAEHVCVWNLKQTFKTYIYF
jgi:hypothetical protein